MLVILLISQLVLIHVLGIAEKEQVQIQKRLVAENELMLRILETE